MALKKSQIYSSLWQSCDELRGGMDASQYKEALPAFVWVRQEAKGSDRSQAVIPAKAGIHFPHSRCTSLSYRVPTGFCSQGLDSRFRGNDEAGLSRE